MYPDLLPYLDLSIKLKNKRRQVINGQEEPRSAFLKRIMLHASEKARVLKLADRISNITGLPLIHDKIFTENYTKETKQYILPYANEINPVMAAEIRDSIESTLKILHNGL
jgi:GTP pyrophosphokinase